MNDIHALSGAYALDALDDVERTEFEKHLAVCDACRAEVASFRETAALLASSEAVPPPASLRTGVLAAISQVRPLPPEPAKSSAPADEIAVRRRRLPAILAVAAAVVLLAVGAVMWHPWQQTTSAVDEVLQASDAVRTTQPLEGGGELTLVRSASLDRAVMLGKDVPEPAAGTTYQLWLQQDGKMVTAGLMPDATKPTVLSGDVGTATAAAVSVEPDGGSSQPTTDPIALFAFDPGESGSSGGDGA